MTIKSVDVKYVYKMMAVTPMVNAALPYPEEFQTRELITDDLPADAMGEIMAAAVQLARKAPAFSQLPPTYYVIQFLPL